MDDTDPAAEQTPPASTDGALGEQGAQGKENEPLGEPGLSALHKERERANAAEKQAAEYKAKVDAAESAKLSDIERANKERDDAKAELAQSRTSLARAEALAKFPVPADYQDLVVGTDAASFEASAKKIHELHTRAEGKAPRPDPVPGAGTGSNNPPASGGLAAGRAAYAAKKAK